MSFVPTEPLVSALIAVLKSELTEQVADMSLTSPITDSAGWVVVQPVPGGRSLPALGSSHGTMEIIVAVVSYGHTRAQAAVLADAVASIMLDRTNGAWRIPIVGAGFTVSRRSLWMGQRSGVVSAGEEPNQVQFWQPDRYVLLASEA
jgi:hypothetical protein